MSEKNVYIDKFVDVDNWISFEASEIDLFEQKKCLCCLNHLDEIVHLMSTDKKVLIRIGCCGSCGYVGYIDKPTETWISTFYNNIWDTSESTEKIKLEKWGHSFIVDYIQDLNIEPNKTILDVGCGYGAVLKQLELKGFNKLFGNEHSKHRADFANENVNAEVTHIPYSFKNLDTFKKMSPRFNIIYCKSVLEHMYDPNEFFLASQSLQEEGDYLILAVPDAEQETALTKIFFVPHLHSYSSRSLELIAQRYGYKIKSVHIRGAGLHVIAQKVNGNFSVNDDRDFIGPNGQLSLLKEEFFIDRLTPDVEYILWSHKRDRKIRGLIPKNNQFVYFKILFASLFCFFPTKLNRILFRLLFKVPQKRKMLKIHCEITGFESDRVLKVFQERVRLYYK